MIEIALLLIIIAVIIGIVTVVLALKMKKEGVTKEPDYRAFFIMGISFLPMGIVFTTIINPGFISFIGLGVIYISIGLAHKDKWKERDK